MSTPMVVVADDFSGAAELAALAAARGLAAEVHRRGDGNWQADVIALDADARSLDAAAAAQRWQQIARQVLRRRPAALYVKVDSVLRGHPHLQIAAFLHASGRRRALLVPANPSHGRQIVGGRYTIHGRPLEASALAHDPQYPRTTSDVAGLLPGGNVCVLRRAVGSAADLPPAGILVPDAGRAEDVQALAALVDDATLAAGAADFFAALLDARGRGATRAAAMTGMSALCPRALLVCGSPTGWRQRAGQCQAAGLAVYVWHETSADDRGGDFPPLFPTEAEALAARLRTCGAAVLALGDPRVPLPQAEAMLARFSQAAGRLVQLVQPGSVLVEGGATAAQLAAALGWQRFGVLPQSGAGVGLLVPHAWPLLSPPTMAPDSNLAPAALGPDLVAGAWNRDVAGVVRLWIKPGSYPWPAEVWHGLVSCSAGQACADPRPGAGGPCSRPAPP